MFSSGQVSNPVVDVPSEWVVRWSAQIPRHGRVLDLACGAGRHARFLAGNGFAVDAVDRDIACFRDPPGGVTLLQADLEGAPWPYPGVAFDAIVVTNYLHRPLFADLCGSISPGGVLIYETFAAGNERFGKPSNPDFLLRRGELLAVVSGAFSVLGFEECEVAKPRPAVIQRICAKH